MRFMNFFALERQLEAETLIRGNVKNDLVTVLGYHFHRQHLLAADCPVFPLHLIMLLKILTMLPAAHDLWRLVISHKRSPFSLSAQ